MRFNDIDYGLIDLNKPVKVFCAKKVITMDENRPEAEAIAIQDGYIVGVGSKESVLRGLKVREIQFETDMQFENYYIYPGFAEHHMHPQIMGSFMTGGNYIGFTDRTTAEGGILPGIQSIEKLKARIKELVVQNEERLKKGGNEWLNCWGFDPLMLQDADVTRDVLDEVCKDYPLCIYHASAHIMNLNSAGLKLAGYDKLPPSPFLPRYEDGRIDGTIEEPEMMRYAFEAGASRLDYSLEGMIKASEISTKIARIKGCTSVTDKGTNFPLTPKDIASRAWVSARDQKKIHTRVNMEVWFNTVDVWDYKGKKAGMPSRKFKMRKTHDLVSEILKSS